MSLLVRLGQEHSKVLKNFSLLAVTLQKIESKGTELLSETRDVKAVSDMLEKSVPDHFALEEKYLFPYLLKFAPDEKKFVSELLDEHEKVRKEADLFLSAMHAPEVPRDKLAGFLTIVAEDLSAHARKEDEKLLPLARRVLSEAELKELDRLVSETDRT